MADTPEGEKDCDDSLTKEERQIGVITGFLRDLNRNFLRYRRKKKRSHWNLAPPTSSCLRSGPPSSP
ncbi:hypothetical protein HPP92_009068 [Vanilla planifolia]|uniref:Uncharacterized protein n=1 Tax=Vanilla planifolia TaxID=51239 RepID=A0A835V2I3_VANPL|nr:hypothetical protein HPP92_009068 [Vanilla planifolia]